jgi:hypothetical protein
VSALRPEIGTVAAMTVWTGPAAPQADEMLRAEVVEQVMRVTDDDVLLLPFLDAVPGSRAAHAALGRLLSGCTLRLVVGCPLMAFVGGTVRDPQWRRAYPPAPDSLWAKLEFLATIYGPAGGTHPYEALELLRERSEDDVTL